MNKMMEMPNILDRWNEALRCYDAIRQVPDDQYGTLRLCVMLVMIARSYYSDKRWRVFKCEQEKVLYLGVHATQFLAVFHGMANTLPRIKGKNPLQFALEELETWTTWAEKNNLLLMTVRRPIDDTSDWEVVRPGAYVSQMMSSFNECQRQHKLNEAEAAKNGNTECRVDQHDPENNNNNNNN